MTVKLSQGLYTLMTGLEGVVRSNYASIKSTVDTEMAAETVSLPAMQTGGGNIYIGDGRIPPQTDVWVRFTGRTLSERPTFSTQSRTRLGVTVTCGVRRTSLATTDSSPHVDSAGWRVCSVLATAVTHTIIRHASSIDGVYNVDQISSAGMPFEQKRPSTFEYETQLGFWMITYHAYNT